VPSENQALGLIRQVRYLLSVPILLLLSIPY
jgi:hypothetical protein